MKLQYFYTLFLACCLGGLLQAQSQCVNDCVWPGDANGDGIANIFDVLPIALANGTEGLPRPDASTQWLPQTAPDWGMIGPDGKDYKHLDADGDGFITLADLDVVNENYDADADVSAVQINDQPQNQPAFIFAFDQTEIYFDPYSPQEYVITAGIYLATNDLPVQNLHGLALQLQYPQDLSLPHSISFSPQNSFFGSVPEIYLEEEEIVEYSRMEAAFTRTDGTGSTGSGRIATVEFIVIGDIIGGRSEMEIDYYVHIENLKAIDASGNYISFDIFTPNPHFTLIKEEATATETPEDEQSIRVFPNPAKDKLFIKGLSANAVCSLFNLQGHLLLQTTSAELNVAQLPRGLYLLEIKDEENSPQVRKVLLE